MKSVLTILSVLVLSIFLLPLRPLPAQELPQDPLGFENPAPAARERALVTASADSNVTLLGRWANEPCYAVFKV